MEEVRGYMDAVKPGMKEILTEAEKARENETVDVAWAVSHNPLLGAEAVQVWRALKKLTEDHSEARQVVTSVPGEDGYAAWIKLHRRYGMALSMRQGTMLSNFSHLGSTKMKTPSETRSRVIEIDKMAKTTQEVTGDVIGDGHWKSVLVGMLDPPNTPTRFQHDGFEGHGDGPKAGHLGIYFQRRAGKLGRHANWESWTSEW